MNIISGSRHWIEKRTTHVHVKDGTLTRAETSQTSDDVFVDSARRSRGRPHIGRHVVEPKPPFYSSFFFASSAFAFFSCVQNSKCLFVKGWALSLAERRRLLS